MDRRFLAYLIPLPLQAINDLTYFTTVKHLSSDDLLNERLPVPPLAAQRAIADFLDRETARIDALITAKRRMVEALGARFESLRTRLISEGLASSPSKGLYAMNLGRARCLVTW